ncbi:MAG: hypothetical protein H0U75_06310 [Legionella sp.]|nr:hypothetical protein [Legionella sp.]
MRVLIITEPDDIHAVMVNLALKQKGVDCELFFSADMPTKQKNTIFISSDDYSWDSIDGCKSYPFENHFDSIWWRRPRRPKIPDNLHEQDKNFAKIENSIYHDSIPFLLNEGACWINPIASHQKTRSKIVQLKLAQQCRFKIPETLITNSPEDIKAFLLANKKNNIIYKPFSPHYWAGINETRIVYTDKISMDDLPSDQMLQAVPGIYQKYIEKKYELRVTCFGTHIQAIKIDSQNSSSPTDWRKIPRNDLQISEVQLPQPIKNKIILYMIKMGVVFGCFDFIVTPNDEYIFLELNEQGQFLWVEELLPELCYLEMFSEFIMNKRFDFTFKKTANRVHVAELYLEAINIIEDNISQHVFLNQIKQVA